MSIRLACLILLPVVSNSKAAEPDGKYDQLVAKGLQWLVQQQSPTGRWSDSNPDYPVPVTALSGMAFLMEGSTPTKGRYAPQIRKALDWILRQKRTGKRDFGLIATRVTTAEGRPLFANGHAILFLAAVLPLEQDSKRQKLIRATLMDAVDYTCRAQTQSGGWGYRPADIGGQQDEGASTLCQIHALVAAQRAGIPIPGATLKKALGYMKKLTNKNGSLRYRVDYPTERPALAVVAAAVVSPTFKETQPQWLQWLKRSSAISIPTARYPSYTHFYLGQLAYRLGEREHARLLPKASSRIQWSTYRNSLFEHYKSTQQSDGSWRGSPSNVYTTATTLIVLQLEKEKLPLFAR